jgi:aldehyde:ferredoxin oxidoreductase
MVFKIYRFRTGGPIMPLGYTGKILHVNLSDRKIDVETPDETFYRMYLGGRGLGYHYLLKMVPAGIDPFDPRNVLVLATGVMTGSPLAAACRFAAVGKSPLTGTAGESEAAGFFGPELKKAGFDAVVFQGRAENPVYLWVTDGRAELKDAAHLAELGARTVEDTIRAELGNDKIRVAQCGLAGMNRVRYANITNNLGHFNGRGGFGALMGSKNLRAVAALGSGSLAYHDPEFLRSTAKAYAKTFRENPAGEALYVYGTTAFPAILSNVGALPVDNFRRSAVDDPTSISGDTYTETLLKKRKGCHACPIMCKRVIENKEGPYQVDSRYGGPEYETIAGLGTNLNIFDLKAIAKANEVCNRYCMDTISAGMTIAFACECFQNGVIGKDETGGLELRSGDPGQLLELLEMIAHREGFGDLLAEGSARLAQKWGVPDSKANLTVKGQEIPMHDPRVKVGVGMSYALSTYGADHMYTVHDPAFVDADSFSLQSVKSLGIYRPMSATDVTADKVRAFVKLERLWRMMDSLGLCVFGFAPRGVMPLETLVDCLRAITGWNTDLHELMAAGERGVVMARAFNSREGFRPSDDRLPERLFDPKPDGPRAGEIIFSPADFKNALKQYYGIIDCDAQTGRPGHGKLIELDLEWVGELIA